MSNWSRMIIIAVAIAMAPCQADDNRLVRLVSLEWQPYSGVALRDQGAAAAVVKAAFQAAGYSVDIDFYPWARAVHLVEADNEYDGIFPVYYSAARSRWLDCSDTIGHSPLGFAERRKAPVAWSVLADLHAYKIGVVRDYVNTEAFDSMVAAGRIDVEVVGSDLQNLQKLAHGRIDLAVIDRYVLEYLLKGPLFKESAAAADPSREAPMKATTKLTETGSGGADTQGFAGLQFNKRVLENKNLYICFKRSFAEDRIKAAFSAGLQKIDVDAVIAQYMRQLDKEAVVPASISR